MGSPWQLPLPLEEYATLRVVVYFHSDRWIPIPCFCLSEAIALYRKALLQGKEICVFPVGLDLETENILSLESCCLPDKLACKLACDRTAPSHDLTPLAPTTSTVSANSSTSNKSKVREFLQRHRTPLKSILKRTRLLLLEVTSQPRKKAS